MLNQLATRRREPEVMDQPGLDLERHHAALAGLARVNLFSRTARLFWKHLPDFSQRQPFRILDVACGGGDVLLRLGRIARRQGLAVELTGIDVSEAAVCYARENASRLRIEATFQTTDVMSDEWPGRFDAAVCSLFLHHLDDDEAVLLLRKMIQYADRLLVSDLIRSRLGYLLCVLGTRVLSRCDVVHTDGPLSVRAAFTPAEAATIARKAGLDSVEITRHWPERFLLKWERS